MDIIQYYRETESGLTGSGRCAGFASGFMHKGQGGWVLCLDNYGMLPVQFYAVLSAFLIIVGLMGKDELKNGIGDDRRLITPFMIILGGCAVGSFVLFVCIVFHYINVFYVENVVVCTAWMKAVWDFRVSMIASVFFFAGVVFLWYFLMWFIHRKFPWRKIALLVGSVVFAALLIFFALTYVYYSFPNMSALTEQLIALIIGILGMVSTFVLTSVVSITIFFQWERKAFPPKFRGF